MRKLIFILALLLATSAFAQGWGRGGAWGRDDIAWGRGGEVSINYNGADAFISEWETENGDAGSTTIVLPLTSDAALDIVVYWGDGTDTIITNATLTEAIRTHAYTSAGTKEVKIVGTLKGFRFFNGGDKLKLTEISQWGCFDISVNAGFYGCANLECTATDAPLISSTNLHGTFWDCDEITQIGNATGWDVKDVTNMLRIFRDANDFNQDISSWDVAQVTTFEEMLQRGYDFNQDLSSWDISSATTMENMLRYTGVLSTANYSAMLEAWGAIGAHYEGAMDAHFGYAKFERGAVHVESTTDGTTAGHLKDSAVNFPAEGVQVDDIICNIQNAHVLTWAKITNVADGDLTLDTDIMVTGDAYELYSSEAAKGKYQWLSDGCDITDRGAD